MRTNTPWYVGKPFKDPYDITFVSIGPFEAEKHYESTIAEVFGANHNAEANAEYIVKACNNHEDMVDLVIDLVLWLKANYTKEEVRADPELMKIVKTTKEILKRVLNAY